MRKIFIFITLIITLVLTSCVKLRTYTISFELDGGSDVTPLRVEVLQVINPESLPITEKENYIFIGWFFKLEDEESISEPFTIISDTTLYAKWAFDETAKVNYSIVDNLLQWESNVKKFRVDFEQKQIDVSEAQFNLLEYSEIFKNPTIVKVFAISEEKSDFIFSSIIHYKDQSVIFEGSNFLELKNNARFEFTNTVLTAYNIRMTARVNNQAIIRLNDIADLQKLVMNVSSNSRNQILNIAYMNDGNEVIGLYPYIIDQSRQVIEIDINKHEAATSLSIVLEKSSTVTYTYIHQLTILGKETGHKFIEIEKEN